MNWQNEIRGEFTRLAKQVDDSVIEELAQHATAAYEAARADGATTAEAEARVRALIGSWCAGTTGPRRIAGPRSPDGFGGAGPRVTKALSGTLFSGVFQDVMFGARMLARSPGLSAVVLVSIAFGAGLNAAVFMQFQDAFLRPP